MCGAKHCAWTAQWSFLWDRKCYWPMVRKRYRKRLLLWAWGGRHDWGRYLIENISLKGFVECCLILLPFSIIHLTWNIGTLSHHHKPSKWLFKINTDNLQDGFQAERLTPNLALATKKAVLECYNRNTLCFHTPEGESNVPLLWVWKTNCTSIREQCSIWPRVSPGEASTKFHLH